MNITDMITAADEMDAHDMQAVLSGVCEGNVYWFTGRDGVDHFARCGKYIGGEQMFCDPCEQKFMQMYPQGWNSYPGDVCSHGVYVGGVGIDWMCQRCEFGDDD